MKTAQKIKDLTGWNGNATLYRLVPPHEETEYVVVSAVSAMFSGPETYIFASDESGKDVNFREMDGSYRGGYSHEAALKGLGYTIEAQ